MKKIFYVIMICTLIIFNSINVNAEAHVPHETDMLVNEEDLRYMSCIIYHEAENQCEAGKQAVGIVIMNRVVDDSEDWGDTVKEVIYKPGQFAGLTDRRMKEAFKLYEKGELPNECINAAIYALGENKTVIYNNKEIDLSDYLYFAREWSDARLKIQDHDFK